MCSSERVFSVNGYHLAARQWHPAGKTNIIALHGWLDNAASFHFLAPLLPDCHLIALDVAGHGLSAHKPPQAGYNIWDDLLDILAVADAIGWHSFTLLGHSRGAIVSSLLAAVSPERVERLILLDGIEAQTVEPQDSVRQMAQFIKERRAMGKKRLPVYPTVEAAIAMRCKASGLSEHSARPLVERGTKAVAGGFTWRTDPALMAASAVKMTPQHNQAFIQAITAPVLLLLAQQGLGADAKRVARIQQYRGIECHLLPGGHHFHLEQPVDDIARRIIAFIQR